jgi:hypothetical protein
MKALQLLTSISSDPSALATLIKKLVQREAYRCCIVSHNTSIILDRLRHRLWLNLKDFP